MATTTQTTALLQQPAQRPLRLLIVMGWMGILGVALLIGALNVWQIETFFNYGPIVTKFIAVVLGIVAIASFLCIWLLWSLNNNGRITAMMINFFGAGFGLLYTAQLLGLFVGVDTLAANIFSNWWLLLGFPIGYALVWLGRRFDFNATAHEWLQKIGIGIMMLTLIALILVSGWPALLVQNPSLALSQLFNPAALAALAVTALFTAAGIALMRMGSHFGETILQREAWQGWMFLLPNFITFTLFFALPLILSFYLSFTNYDAISEAEYVGLDNYVRLLSLDFQVIPQDAEPSDYLRLNHFEIGRITIGSNALVIGARDPMFWESLGRTIRYVILLLTFSILPALGLAMLLNSKIPGMKVFRAIYFIPSIAAVVGVALIWQWLYNPVIGYINYAITEVVNFLNNLFGISIVDPQIDWLTNDNVMLISVVIMAAWQVIGFNTVILLAGLQNVPKDLIEASTVDGAGPITRFRRIILPLLGPTTFFVIVTTLISGMQAFSEFYTLLGNTTSSARITVVYYLYEQGFQRFQMGFASATAWVLFAVIFAITIIQFRISRSNEAYRD
jgi:ABC-type sugar transport system permease subunit